MSRDLASRQWEQFYSTGQHNLANDFYGPAISHSVLIERAVGFFRSTAYLLLYEELCDFLHAGGKLKLICSPRMHREDVQAFQRANGINESSHDGVQELLEEIQHLQGTEDGKLHLKLLGGMLRFGLAEFKIAFTSEGDGMFHEKIGILHDSEGQTITFSGSANETLCGWGITGNVESFDVFCSWKGGDTSRIENHRNAFLQAWEGKRPGVRTVDLDQAVAEHLLQEAPEDKEDLFRTLQAYQILKRSLISRQSQMANPSVRTLTDEWPSGRTAEPHQQTGLNAWQANGYRGILKHATGSGKTFTALHAVRDQMRQGVVSLVTVPSTLLFEGWLKEMRSELPNAVFLLAGNGHTRWKDPYRLEAFTDQTVNTDRRIILVTMQTASDLQFIRRLKRTEDMLLVADEVHQLGSPEMSNIMSRNFGKRLGLSATPERYGDPDGTHRLFDYFGGVVGGEFTLKDAMNAGRLVPYRYYPVFVTLDNLEREKWRDLTLRIRKAAASSSDSEGNISNADYLKRLLIGRARLAKKALKKVQETTLLLREYYREGQHWLIYCEDQEQMGQVTTALRSVGMAPLIYHSSMQGDNERTLAHFVAVGGIMVSIRCLDEGVDIPQISHAIILASSQNPRQFIQRRGRVLRVAANKSLAYIWDILVLPLEDDNKDAQFQDALTRAEMVRAIEFANTAINQAQASELRTKAIDLGIDPATVYPDQEEEQTI